LGALADLLVVIFLDSVVAPRCFVGIVATRCLLLKNSRVAVPFSTPPRDAVDLLAQNHVSIFQNPYSFEGYLDPTGRPAKDFMAIRRAFAPVKGKPSQIPSSLRCWARTFKL